MVTTENEKQKAFGIHILGRWGRRLFGVKLCFETTEATSYLLEAHDIKEVEISI